MTVTKYVVKDHMTQLRKKEATKRNTYLHQKGKRRNQKKEKSGKAIQITLSNFSFRFYTTEIILMDFHLNFHPNRMMNLLHCSPEW